MIKKVITIQKIHTENNEEDDYIVSDMNNNLKNNLSENNSKN